MIYTVRTFCVWPLCYVEERNAVKKYIMQIKDSDRLSDRDSESECCRLTSECLLQCGGRGHRRSQDFCCECTLVLPEMLTTFFYFFSSSSLWNTPLKPLKWRPHRLPLSKKCDSSPPRGCTLAFRGGGALATYPHKFSPTKFLFLALGVHLQSCIHCTFRLRLWA